MNFIKEKFNHLFITLFCMTVTSPAFAKSSANDLFKPLNDKTSELTDQVTTWATYICILLIVCFGVATMTSKFSKFWGVCIMGGATIILVASQMASFLLS